MPRTRRAVAVGCIALILCAAFLPLAGVSLEWLVLTPPFVLLPPVSTALVWWAEPSCQQRALALLAIVDSRGPPTNSSLL